MTAPAIIQDLVKRFRDSRELYRSGRYNEAQLRQEFLNPLFEALGWDMYNRSNFAPQYREVIHEDSLEDQGSVKAPDYAFRIGTTRKFFVEAKKPAVDIRYDIHPAYQLRRYAWNAHLPLSILSDFEELAVYDCRTRPDPGDSAATGRVMLFSFEEYLTRWDELAQTFSKDAVWNGSFDRYAEGSKGKRGTTEVDAEFLKEIEQWRLLLARNIALRNFRPTSNPVIASEAKQSQPASQAKQSQSASEAKQSQPASEAKQSRPASEAKQSQSASEAKQSPNLHRVERQLNYAVQTTIDRILFLRICEDRKIEPTDQLLQIAEGSDVYAQLLLLFQKADQKYNSGLFHFNKEKGQTSDPDTFTPTLQIDDKVLRQIIKSTYYPCPYMFNEIPVEILGQVYEQFLGSVIRLTPGGQAKVEEKPEVRKAGGVYYTPSYIVDYIVKNTLGRLLGDFAPVPEIVPVSSRSTPPPKAGVGVPSTESDRQVSTSPIVPASAPSTGTDRQVSTSPIVPVSNPSPIVPASTPSTGIDRQVSTSPTSKEQLTPAQALNLRVVDPACGSGSFLLGAYQYLLDWHLNYYLRHDPQSHTRGKNPPLVATEGGEYRLTTETKKRILTSSIYGVDIDAQAVEVTKLSLLLKLLEGETGQLSFGFERVLPNLDQNIRCGNSLIGWDYFQGQMFPDEEELQRVNPFDWQRAFPQVFAAGGFDAVIGNPPYIFARSQGIDNQEKLYFYNKFDHQKYQLNTYSLFIEEGLSLIKDGGFLGFIIPNNWLSISSMKQMRDLIIRNSANLAIVNNKYKVFSGANIDTSIVTLSKGPSTKVCLFESVEPGNIQTVSQLDPNFLLSQPIIPFQIANDDQASSILQEMSANSIPLGKISTVKSGLKAYEIGKGIPKQTDSMKRQRIYHTNNPQDNSYRKYLEGKDVKRYEIDWSGQYLKYGKNLAAPRDPHLFHGERILVRQIPSKPPYSINGMIVNEDYVNDINSMIVIDLDSKYNVYYILGILNSRLISYWFDKYFGKFQRKIFPQFKVNELAKFPILLSSNPTLVSEISTLAMKMIELRKRKASIPLEFEQLKREISATNSALDRKVYELYDLNNEEIRIVESNS